MSRPVAIRATASASATGPRLHYALGGERSEAPRVCNAYRSKSCTEYSRNKLRKRERSNARSCRVLHVCAVLYLARFARQFGLTRPPSNWLQKWAVLSAPQLTKFLASGILRRDLSRPSSLRSQSEAKSPSGVGPGNHQPRSTDFSSRRQGRARDRAKCPAGSRCNFIITRSAACMPM